MTCHQPNEDLLLVIDMQNVYTDGQPWACCGVEQAADAIRRLLDAQVCGQVMFTRFLPPENPVGVWAEYNQVNAAINADPFANAMMPEFAPYLERYPLLDKSVYSSFAIPEEAGGSACPAGSGNRCGGRMLVCWPQLWRESIWGIGLFI